MSNAPRAPAAPDRWIARWGGSPFAGLDLSAPGSVLDALSDRLRVLLAALAHDAWTVDGDVAVHRTARVEGGAALSGPALIGPHAFVAATACLRGGTWLDARVSIGRGCELKGVLVFEGSALAHFNYLGDAIVGADVNFEAGSVVCNHRNERAGAHVHVRIDGRRLDTGRAKFGALVGDGCRIGANAVLAPGTLLAPGTVVPRLALIDQDRQE
jgi:bifunctional N-acetylglucosamine-1-phosphate-uridyltransferase/glucosamine-1-phosphate-acetyltransferase GlmU-like protein